MPHKFAEGKFCNSSKMAWFLLIKCTLCKKTLSNGNVFLEELSTRCFALNMHPEYFLFLFFANVYNLGTKEHKSKSAANKQIVNSVQDSVGSWTETKLFESKSGIERVCIGGDC